MAEETRHPIQVVARRTGLTPDIIRAWERRYGAVVPERSASSRRLYSDADVERLLLLRRATRAGRRIGDVAHLAVAQLQKLVDQDEAAVRRMVAVADTTAGPGAASLLEECLKATERLDAPVLESALTRASNQLGVYPLLQEVVTPLLRAIGDRWKRGSIRICHEHLTTTLVRALLGMLRAAHARPGPGPGIVVATPAGQSHELGALMAAVTASAEGWRVSYLGPDLPAEEIAHAAIETNSVAAAVSVLYPEDARALTGELGRLVELLPRDMPLAVGGSGAQHHQAKIRDLGARCFDDLTEFAAYLGEVRASVATKL